MKIHMSLLMMLQRQMFAVTMIALPIGCLSVLLMREPLEYDNAWLAWFILLHSICMVFSLGRFRSKSFAFLYSRGYSWDAIWCHKMLSTALSVLWVWGAMALVVWTPLRSIVQDKMYASPYYPLFAIKEVSVPWAWLMGYAVLLPMFHYVWIRRAQPTLGGEGSVLIAISMVVVIITLRSFRWHQRWFEIMVMVLAGVVVVTNLVAGWLLHRKLEVQK